MSILDIDKQTFNRQYQAEEIGRRRILSNAKDDSNDETIAGSRTENSKQSIAARKVSNHKLDLEIKMLECNDQHHYFEGLLND